MTTRIGPLLLCLAAVAGATQTPAVAADGPAKVVLIAGRPSHGPGEHEFNAGTKLMVECLKTVPGIEPVFVAGGWPADESVFEGAKSVVFFMDGGGNHPMIKPKAHMATVQKLMDKGVGLVCLHYAVEFPKGEVGDKVLDWLGGYYETDYSDNPHNDATIRPTPGHPVTSGVTPFRSEDEWYYKIRFRPGDSKVTPILTAEALKGHDGKTYNNEVVGWATERADGGRSFGCTGAHFHRNWAIPEFRTLMLNSILWTAKVDVPAGGVKSDPTADQLKANLDPKPSR